MLVFPFFHHLHRLAGLTLYWPQACIFQKREKLATAKNLPILHLHIRVRQLDSQNHWESWRQPSTFAFLYHFRGRGMVTQVGSSMVSRHPELEPGKARLTCVFCEETPAETLGLLSTLSIPFLQSLLKVFSISLSVSVSLIGHPLTCQLFSWNGDSWLAIKHPELGSQLQLCICYWNW